ncbi:MAG: NADH-quinone oxidoreductase subunit N, partial [Actinomycetota bacterium]
AAFFYIRVIVMMFLTDPEDDSVTVSFPSRFTSSVIWIAAIATLALGIFPTPILDVISSLATFIR